jgi:beta-alanine degradation protein BauB
MSHAERVVHVDTSDARVTEWRLAPGASTKQRCHTCDCVVVPLTGGRIRFRRADGDIVVDIVPGASVLRSAPVEIEALNDGADRIAFVEIELKDTARRLISG